MLNVLFGKITRVNKNTILVLAEYIGENHNSTAYYWSQIVKHLQESYDVILLTPHTEHSIEFSEKYHVVTRFIQFAEHNKNGLFSRLFGQINQTKLFLRALSCDIDKVDLVFSGTNPIITMFAIAAMRFRWQFKWLVLIHDVFPNNLVPAKVLRKSSLLYRLLTYLSKKVYSSPDNMICIGRDMKQLIEYKTGKQGNSTVVPNWASTELISVQPKSENEIISYLNWRDKIVFQFFGNMGRLQGIDNLLRAIELTEHQDARFLFIGCGSESKCVAQLAKSVNQRAGYERINYYGKLDLKKNNIGLNACDVAMVTLSNEMFGLGVPSKAYFSMAADKPILYVGDKGSELDLLLSDYQLGWKCVGDNPDELAKLIDSITVELLVSSRCYEFKPRKVLEESFSELMALRAISRIVQETIES
ncbi:putative glycosyl transferase [Shewanella baltica]|nr:putative glycosyl transferase [Shewanella baltica]